MTTDEIVLLISKEWDIYKAGKILDKLGITDIKTRSEILEKADFEDVNEKD